MEEMKRVMELWEKLYPIIIRINKEELLMLIGMAIDYNASANGGDPAEYIRTLAAVSKQVNDEMGRA